MKKLVLNKLTISLLLVQFIFGTIQLSDKAEISILTCKPGTELYSSFGHNAIRINDQVNGIDKVFNYGIFDFNTPKFYTKFVLGKLDYRLAVSEYLLYKQQYIFDDRTIIEQTLNLPRNMQQSLYDLLLTNYLPENRYYRYDFFYDNCSTRLRNIIDKATNDKLINSQMNIPTGISYRNSLKQYLVDRQWLNFGMDLVLGLPADKIMSSWEFTFLPDEMFNYFQNTVWAENGKHFVSKNDVIYESSRNSVKYTKSFSPTKVLWIIFLFYGIVIWLTNRNHNEIPELIIFALAGILGCILLFLWFFTEHKSMANNLNILWAIPLHIPVVILYKWLSDRIITCYFFITGILMVFLLIGWNFIHQEFSIAVIPIVLMLLISSISVYSKAQKRLSGGKELS